LVTLDIQIATLFRSPTDTPKDRAAASPRAKTEPDLAMESLADTPLRSSPENMLVSTMKNRSKCVQDMPRALN
jgi:hypothetical protein